MFKRHDDLYYVSPLPSFVFALTIYLSVSAFLLGNVYETLPFEIYIFIIPNFTSFYELFSNGYLLICPSFRPSDIFQASQWMKQIQFECFMYKFCLKFRSIILKNNDFSMLGNYTITQLMWSLNRGIKNCHNVTILVDSQCPLIKITVKGVNSTVDASQSDLRVIYKSRSDQTITTLKVKTNCFKDLSFYVTSYLFKGTCMNKKKLYVWLSKVGKVKLMVR